MNQELQILVHKRVTQAQLIKILHTYTQSKFDSLKCAVFGSGQLRLEDKYLAEQVRAPRLLSNIP